jgi:hypothetical protein
MFFHSYSHFNITNLTRLLLVVVLEPWQESERSCIHTFKPVLRGHLRGKKKWPFKTGDLLKEVQLI